MRAADWHDQQEESTTYTGPSIREPRLRHAPPGNEEESWQECARLVEKYDAEMCKGYREEIDTLMVFVRPLFDMCMHAQRLTGRSFLGCRHRVHY